MSWVKGRHVRLRSLFARRNATGRPDLPMLSVYRDFGVVLREGRVDNNNKPGEDPSAYRVVRPGDLVLNKMKTWQGSLGISAFEGIVSPAYYVARPLTGDSPAFLHHLLRSGPLIAEYGARSKGIRPSQWDLPWEEFQDITIELPPVTTQGAVADYLDLETERIDTLIAAKEALISRLEERLASALDEEVWALSHPRMQLRRVVERFIDYRGATPTKTDEGIPLVTASHVRGGRIDLSTEPQFIDEMTYHMWMQRGWPAAGDVVMTMEAPLGEVGTIVDPTVALAQRLILFKARPSRVLSEYLAHVLRSRSFQATLQANATGSTAVGIKAERLKALVVPIPPLTAQNSMSRRFSAEDEKVQRANQLRREQVRLFRERRQALITAAVTGALDIPGVAA